MVNFVRHSIGRIDRQKVFWSFLILVLAGVAIFGATMCEASNIQATQDQRSFASLEAKDMTLKVWKVLSCQLVPGSSKISSEDLKLVVESVADPSVRKSLLVDSHHTFNLDYSMLVAGDRLTFTFNSKGYEQSTHAYPPTDVAGYLKPQRQP